MYILTIANQKGGSGKTTSCLALGQAFALAGKRVLYVDADAQASLTRCMTAKTPTKTMTDLVTGNDPVSSIIQNTENGDIIAAGVRMAASNTETGMDLRRLRTRLEAVKNAYDVAVVDTQPGIGILTQLALFAADGVIVPAMPDRFGLEGLKAFYKTFKKTTADRSRAGVISPLVLLGVIVTQYQGRTTLHKQVLEAMQAQAAQYTTKVYLPPIRTTVRVTEWQYTSDVYGTRSTAGDDYKAVADEIMKDIKI